MSSEPQESERFGFSRLREVEWSDYIQYRPIYKESFFRRILDYHTQKSEASLSLAHDVGAGHGIVAATLAKTFNRVVVSDPSEGYNEVARQLLIGQCGWPESKFRFLQEGAERSSVETATVDLITACECLHWTSPAEAIDEFARQLKTGGTLAITYYVWPIIVGNERAQWLWTEVFKVFSKRPLGPLYHRATQICSNGYESIAIPAEQWANIKRVYVNASKGIESFKMPGTTREINVGSDEERVWIYGDPDWSEEQGVDWLKKYSATWVPPPPELQLKHLWEELDLILKDAKVRIETPLVMIFATRRR
ncbi:S-adenosyl-L-methionine-dependent methyltransferase [Xylaria arbuscula]|nr:S-adenosyl-L-methionine-dependent methyltransferase [Xylaria arbuscula]